jgi:hypothetical protein
MVRRAHESHCGEAGNRLAVPARPGQAELGDAEDVRVGFRWPDGREYDDEDSGSGREGAAGAPVVLDGSALVEADANDVKFE